MPVHTPDIASHASLIGVIKSKLSHQVVMPVHTPDIASHATPRPSTNLSYPITAIIAAASAPGIPMTGAAINKPRPAMPPTSISSQLRLKSNRLAPKLTTAFDMPSLIPSIADCSIPSKVPPSPNISPIKPFT